MLLIEKTVISLQRQIKTNTKNANIMKKALIIVALALSVLSCSGQGKNIGQEAIKGKTATIKTNNNNKQNQKGMKTQELTKADFLSKVYNYEKNPNAWKYEGDTPAIVDFYASWCGPCKMLAPTLEALAEEYDGKVVIYKVNTENEQELASVFGIRSIPTMLFIPVSGQPQMAQGAMAKADLKQIIEDVLLK